MAALLGNTGGTTIEEMVVKKRSIALEQDVARAVEAEARAAGVSISAWLNEAAREKLWEARADRATAEALEAAGLKFTEEELAQAERSLRKHGVIPKRGRPPRRSR